jgi:Ca2+/H+ antiporter
MSGTHGGTPLWTVLTPLATLAFIAAEMLLLSQPLASWLLLPAAALLFASVFAAVHHAETIARRVGQPFGSTILALVVLIPEGITPIRAAKANRLQTDINLALGSALASLCLAIPAVALISLALGQDLVLGLEAEHIVLLILSLFMATLSLATGRTKSLQGGWHPSDDLQRISDPLGGTMIKWWKKRGAAWSRTAARTRFGRVSGLNIFDGICVNTKMRRKQR